ncbi:MAG: site-specific tyrosine recombinase XerD [Propionibacteriaceae bacterium]|nr:site-specific tyrosine recombinase XerD [Propionibacteriaceae bacterium]
MTTSADDFDPLVKSYLDHLKAERGLSHHTVSAYARDVARYVDHLRARGIHHAKDVTPVDVADFPVVLTSSGLATASVGRMTVAVRGLHRFWQDEGVSDQDPSSDVAPPTPGRRLPKALSIQQVEALIDATGGRHAGAAPEHLCDCALVETLYGTGARVSEIVALDVDDATRMLADPTMGLTLMGKGSKERLVPVGSYAREALEAWLVRGRPQLAGRTARSTPALFVNHRGGRMSRQSVFNRIEALGEKAGIAQEVSPHTLRHSFATHLMDAGADVRVVQELLGHASVSTTQIYTLVTVDHLREVYRESHPRAQ